MNLNESKPFFSVILPVRNGADTLNTAIVSILAQTFSDYELIIVENASTDNSLAIARAYEKKYDKVRVFHCGDAGVSRARNIGLDNARGEYIVFVDADDQYVPDALKQMHSALESEKADLLIAGFTNYPCAENDEVRIKSGRELYLALLDRVRLYSRIVDDGTETELLLRHQCSRAYRREMLEAAHIRFNEDCPMFVDLIFNTVAYPACERALILFKKLYKYNRGHDSVTSRKGLAAAVDSIPAFNALVRDIESLDKQIADAVLFSAFRMLVHIIQLHTKQPSEECRAVLTRLFETDEARFVVANVRSDDLHFSPATADLLRLALKNLRENDLDGAIKTVADMRFFERKPRISVISPVYNSEKHLKRCIDSILAQSFREFEAIFIDDASTDGSYELLKSCAEADRRVRVIRLSENAGQGNARNRGIEAARGKYLSFVDSDDMIAPDFLELLYKKAEASGREIVKGTAIWIKNEEIPNSKLPKRNEALREKLAAGLPLAVCFRKEHWSALYRRDFINAHSIRYGASRIGQDTTFLLKACTYAKGIEFEDNALYYYFQVGGSVVHSFNEKRFKGCLDAFAEQMDFINSRVLDKEAAILYVVMNARFVLGIHSYMLCENLPAADAFASRLYGILLRFYALGDLKKRDYALREFINSEGSANIDPMLTVIGLADDAAKTKVRAAALKRMKEHILAQKERE